MTEKNKSRKIHIAQRPNWRLPEHQVTDQHVFMNRRQWIKKMLTASTAIGALGAYPFFSNTAYASHPIEQLFPSKPNDAYRVKRPITNEKDATSYNNFYEFGSHKYIREAAQKMVTDPWRIKVDGMVAKEREIDLLELAKITGLEQRIYRFRCVETWAMVVPWDGVPLAKIIKALEPTSDARYVHFETLADPKTMPGLKQIWYPWPYLEGLTIEESMNDLSFLALGMYGKIIPKQNGAPIRLVVPWKYGFKNIKSIVRIHFSDKMPKTFWEETQGREYGFWANINPEVSHPRWSQASERMLGSDERFPTLKWNGYGEKVAHLYKDLEGKYGERLYR
ncbi:MAG: protein-methionine-sulfoxide reductase catalytic subunit MsrP [Pseudomonadota bacterium]